MRRGSALEVFNRSQHLTEEKPCWYLRYARLDDVVALMGNAFVETAKGFSWPKRAKESSTVCTTEKVTPASDMPRSRTPRRQASDKNFIRRADVQIRQGQGEFFLFQETGDEIFHLNALGRAVWELLAEPLSETEAITLIASIFPETSRAQIERDVVNLFTAFKKRKLLLKA